MLIAIDPARHPAQQPHLAVACLDRSRKQTEFTKSALGYASLSERDTVQACKQAAQRRSAPGAGGTSPGTRRDTDTTRARATRTEPATNAGGLSSNQHIHSNLGGETRVVRLSAACGREHYIHKTMRDSTWCVRSRRRLHTIKMYSCSTDSQRGAVQTQRVNHGAVTFARGGNTGGRLWLKPPPRFRGLAHGEPAAPHGRAAGNVLLGIRVNALLSNIVMILYTVICSKPSSSRHVDGGRGMVANEIGAQEPGLDGQRTLSCELRFTTVSAMTWLV